MIDDSQFNRDKSIDDEISTLKGNTLRLYWLMLRLNHPHRARELQRMAGLSSSSLALHHLNKLIELGLVTINDEGHYIIQRRIRPGLLSFFIGSGRFHAPRFVFYAILNTALLFSCVGLFWWFLNSITILLMAILLLNSIFFWTETFRLWRLQPHY